VAQVLQRQTWCCYAAIFTLIVMLHSDGVSVFRPLLWQQKLQHAHQEAEKIQHGIISLVGRGVDGIDAMA
jgi:hypothetical protein